MVAMAIKAPWMVASVFLGLLTHLTTSSASLSDAQTIKKIDDFIEHLMEAREVEVLSLAIVKDGQTMVTKGYTLDDEKPSANRTPIMHLIASLTKAFTAIVLGQLLRENR